jgi:general secretion pathway protein N
MKSKLSLLIAGIFIYLVFLIANLPAEQVLNRVSLPNHIAIQNVSGSLWQGKAQSIEFNGLRVVNLDWRLSFMPLLWGSVSLQLNGGDVKQGQEISLTGELTTNWSDFSELHSDDFIIYLPTDQVLANVALPIPVKAGGRFRVIINELAFDQQCESLDANGEWLNAQVAGTQGQIELGSFGAILTCVDNVIVAKVAEPNLLGLSLDARVSGLRNISVVGQFKPDDSLPDEVHQAAQFFGQADAQGYRAIKL